MSGTRRVTLRELARRAGVSVTTASDSLNGRGRVQPETRQRLIELADELGYHANAAARNLRRGSANSIGIYLPDDVIAMPYYMDLAQGAAEEASAHGLALSLIPAWRDANRVSAFPIDGLVVVDPVIDDPVIERLHSLHIPVVTCERDLSHATYRGGVTVDHDPAVRGLLDHLAARGAQSIAFIVPPLTTSWAVDIRAAYQSWCEQHNRMPLVRELALAATPYHVRHAATALLNSPHPPDAIMSAHDGGAIGALMAATEKGLSVPGDILVASCVDSSLLQLCTPAITAINLHPRQMGRQVADLLSRLVAHDDLTDVWSVVPTTLEIRRSTLAP